MTEPKPHAQMRSEQQRAARKALFVQATSHAPDTTNPVALRAVIFQVLGIVVAWLIYRYVLIGHEGRLLGQPAEVVVAIVLIVAGMLGTIAGRMKATSPRTAAGIAITNAFGDPLTTPTLDVDQAVVQATALSIP